MKLRSKYKCSEYFGDEQQALEVESELFNLVGINEETKHLVSNIYNLSACHTIPSQILNKIDLAGKEDILLLLGYSISDVSYRDKVYLIEDKDIGVILNITKNRAIWMPSQSYSIIKPKSLFGRYMIKPRDKTDKLHESYVIHLYSAIITRDFKNIKWKMRIKWD